MTTKTTANSLATACCRVAPLLTVAAGISALAGSRQAAAMIAALALVCYAPGINKRERLAWLLISASIVWACARGKVGLLWGALEKGAIYGSLMVAISFVQIPAHRSIVAQAIAARIERKERSNISWTNHMLAHAAGASLNLSGLIILQVAAQRAALDAQARLTTAVVYLRGFSAAPVWSPYSYFTPLVLAAFPALAWWHLLSVGACITVLLLCLSMWMPPEPLDAPREEACELSLSTVSANTPQRYAPWRWCVFAGFFASVIGLMSFSNVDSMTVIVAALPILALIWGGMESLMLGGLPAFSRSVGEHVAKKVPILRTEILALMAAGMLSYTIAETTSSLGFLLPARELGIGGTLLQASLVFIAITALTWLGINPVLFIAPLAALVTNPVDAPFSRGVALVILCSAWALFPTISPFAAATLVTARETGIDAQTLVSSVNARYNRSALIAFSLLVASATAITRFSPSLY